MSYADYAYYTDVYFGKGLTSDDFPRLASKASDFLDYYTEGGAEANSDLTAVKKACCALAEQYALIEAAQKAALSGASQSEGAEVQSESVGSWSKSYRSGGSTAAEALAIQRDTEAKLAWVARQYLTPTGLLYRGSRGRR